MVEICRRRAIWAQQANEPVAAIEATPELLSEKVIPPSALLPESKHACPKCGRIVKQGKFLHTKHCKG